MAELSGDSTTTDPEQVTCKPKEGSRPTRHVHVTISTPDEFTANRAALSLVDWIRAEFGHHVTTDAREWDGTTERASEVVQGPDAERCCVCAGPIVSYHNHRAQPFCWDCADCGCNQDPCVRASLYADHRRTHIPPHQETPA